MKLQRLNTSPEELLAALSCATDYIASYPRAVRCSRLRRVITSYCGALLVLTTPPGPPRPLESASTGTFPPLHRTPPIGSRIPPLGGSRLPDLKRDNYNLVLCRYERTKKELCSIEEKSRPRPPSAPIMSTGSASRDALLVSARDNTPAKARSFWRNGPRTRGCLRRFHGRKLTSEPSGAKPRLLAPKAPLYPTQPSPHSLAAHPLTGATFPASLISRAAAPMVPAHPAEQGSQYALPILAGIAVRTPLHTPPVRRRRYFLGARTVAFGSASPGRNLPLIVRLVLGDVRWLH